MIAHKKNLSHQGALEAIFTHVFLLNLIIDDLFLFLYLAFKSQMESIVHLSLLESMKMTWCSYSIMTLIKGGICLTCMAKCEVTVLA